jgi:hypothetical protein
MSLFVIYFGAQAEHLAGHRATTPSCFGPRYRELIGEIFNKDTGYAEDFSLYLHAPCGERPGHGAAGLQRPSTCCRSCRILELGRRRLGEPRAEAYRDKHPRNTLEDR